MKLYYTKGACSLVVRIILNELGLSFTEESVDLATKQTASGRDFWEINNKGAVPTLELDDGSILTENQVILQYLADHSQNHQLLPAVNTLPRYRVLEWLNYISTELHKSLGMFFNAALAEDLKNHVLIPLIQKRFAYIDSQLSKHPYITGDHLGLADAYLFVMNRWAYYFKIDLSSYSHLKSWTQRMQAHPAVMTSLKQEGL